MIVDTPLVQRVEHSAARLSALEADTLASVVPHSGARWAPLDGGTLVAMGHGRYVNRGVGAAVGEMAPDALLDEVEAFYGIDGLPPSLEVCPWASDALVAELRRRGYVVDWFRNVYAHDLRALPPRSRVQIEEVGDDLEPQWTAVLGSQYEPGSAARTNSDEFSAAVHRVPGAENLVAMIDGRVVGSGSLTAVRTVAWLGGATTLPEARGRGAQYALLADRLYRARHMGCTLAAVTAVPDGASARNLLRVGFQLLYTQAVLTRPLATST